MGVGWGWEVWSHSFRQWHLAAESDHCLKGVGRPFPPFLETLSVLTISESRKQPSQTEEAGPTLRICT